MDLSGLTLSEAIKKVTRLPHVHESSQVGATLFLVEYENAFKSFCFLSMKSDDYYRVEFKIGKEDSKKLILLATSAREIDVLPFSLLEDRKEVRKSFDIREDSSRRELMGLVKYWRIEIQTETKDE